jgi:hypothetical protein
VLNCRATKTENEGPNQIKYALHGLYNISPINSDIGSINLDRYHNMVIARPDLPSGGAYMTSNSI